jgi:hypothetical protein
MQAGFVCAIQAQIMSITLGLSIPEQTNSIRAINALYLGGLILDIASALLAFLSARWLERLSPEERLFLEETFTRQNEARRSTPRDPTRIRRCWDPRRWFHTWMGYSLFCPMPLLVVGVNCMVAGIYIFAWTQQHIGVALAVTLTAACVVPMVLGDFYIGQNEARRRAVIERLSEMQGDW